MPPALRGGFFTIGPPWSSSHEDTSHIGLGPTPPEVSAVKDLPVTQQLQETWVQPWGREDPLEKEWKPTPVFLPGKSNGLGSLVGYSPWGRKDSDMTVHGQRHTSRTTS